MFLVTLFPEQFSNDGHVTDYMALWLQYGTYTLFTVNNNAYKDLFILYVSP